MCYHKVRGEYEMLPIIDALADFGNYYKSMID